MKAWLLLCFFCIVQSASSQNLDSLLEILPSAKPDTSKVVLLSKITIEYLKSDFHKAKKHATEALQLAEKINYPLGIASSHSLLGNVNFESGNYSKALEEYLIALKLYEQVGDNIKVAGLHSNIGLVHTKQQNFDKALEYYKKSLQAKEKLGDSIGMTYTLNAIGGNFFKQKKFDESVKWFKKSIEISIHAGNDRIVVHGYNNLGAVLFRADKLNEAMVYYKKAIELGKQIGDLKAICGLEANIGRVMMKQEKYDGALGHFERSLQMAKEIGSKNDIWHAYGALYDIYDRKKEYKMANKYLLLHNAIKDSLINEKSKQQVNELQIQYETEKKERELAEKELERQRAVTIAEKQKYLLIATGCLIVAGMLMILFYIKQRKAKEKQTKAELEQKALRAQMNPHFIFNSLNSIQRLYVGGKNELANEYTGDFGELLRNILDNSEKTLISVKEEISNLKLYLKLEKLRTNKFDYNINVDDSINQMSSYIPPLIIQPFVENAIWHGILPKGEKGIINVELIKKNEQLIECNIYDNGIGIHQSKKRQNNNHSSKGIKITESRLNYPEAVKIEELPTGGTKVTMLIPLKK